MFTLIMISIAGILYIFWGRLYIITPLCVCSPVFLPLVGVAMATADLFSFARRRFLVALEVMVRPLC